MSSTQSSPPEIADKPKRARKSGLRVKTGCGTCKIRRVKCDEAKPACLRCLKAGMQCDGYGSTKPKPPPKIITTKRSLLPKATLDSTYSSEASILNPDPNASSKLSTCLFDTQEQLYFRYFCKVTAPELSGYFDSSFWGRLILQECHREPSVRKAVVAIAGLCKTKEEAQALLEGSPSKDEFARAEKHHQFALQQYGTAIRLMRDRLTDGKQQIRHALVWCLLIYCFETCHGDHETALHHAITGLTLFSEWLESRLSDGSHLPGLKSPAPSIVEDELIQAFTRLDCEIMTGIDRRPKNQHLRMKTRGTEDIKHMPATFFTLQKARMYWDLIESRSMHYFFSAYERRDGPRQAHEPHIIFSSPESIREEQLIENADLKREIQRWLAAFEPLFQIIRITPSMQDHLMGATVLYTNAHCRLIALDVHIAPYTGFHREMVFDDYNSTFAELTSLTRTAMTSWPRQQQQQQQHPNSPPNDNTNTNIKSPSRFSSDLGVVLNLFRIAMKCRDPRVRRDALDLLKSCRCREGIWDSELCYRAAQWVVNVEERGITADGFVPAEWRICVTSLNCLMNHIDEMSPAGRKPGTLEIKLAKANCKSALFAHRWFG